MRFWIGLSVVQALVGFGWQAWQVWLDQSVRAQNELGRLQKGYTFKDRDRGKVYWYLRSKHKLSRQVSGLGEQLEESRRREHQWEQDYATLRSEYKALTNG